MGIDTIGGAGYKRTQVLAGDDATYYRHLHERDTLRRLIEEYRENRTLGNVLASVETLLDIDAQEKATRDFAEWEKLITDKN